MHDINFYAAFGLAVRVLCTLIVMLYVVPKQFLEVLRPRNQFTALRWIILAMFVTSVTAAVPSIAYQFIRTIGGENLQLRNIATITGNIANAANTALLVLVYTYKIKE